MPLFTVAVHSTDGTTVDYRYWKAAIEACRDAVEGKPGVMATIRDDRGIMMFACDSDGRTWVRSEPIAELAEWDRKRRSTR